MGKNKKKNRNRQTRKQLQEQEKANRVLMMPPIKIEAMEKESTVETPMLPKRMLFATGRGFAKVGGAIKSGSCAIGRSVKNKASQIRQARAALVEADALAGEVAGELKKVADRNDVLDRIKLMETNLSELKALIQEN